MESDIQVENGNYTRIHNEILETLAKVRLSPLEFALLMVIFRKTYGYQKKNDVISISQFCEITGASRTGVIEALNNLVRLKIIYREPIGQMYYYGFNKYYDQWLPEVYISRRSGQTKNFGDKCKSTKQQTDQAMETSKPMENNRSTYGEPVNLMSTSQPMEDTTGQPMENQTGQPMEDTQKKDLKEIKKDLSVQEKPLERKPKNKELLKKSYGEFNNVTLTDDEYRKLQERFPSCYSDWIEKLSTWKESKGKRTKSDYATILNWDRMEKAKKPEIKQEVTGWTREN